MDITIHNTINSDLPVIFEIYDEAIAYQKTAGNNYWLGFEPALILKEISESRHYKILAGDNIVATFCITLSDPLIWKDSDEVAAIYIHRIAIRQSFRGNSILQHIINWAKKYADGNEIDYIRLDTGSGNDRLINYYVRNGFTYLGDTKVNYTPDLPLHYKDGLFALLEMPV